MTAKGTKDVEASVLQRLKNYSESKREDRNLTLCNYAIERFLYRLSLSGYKSQFVLKGAQLFRLWKQASYRPTRDLDLLRHGSPDLDELRRIVAEICQIETDVPDGIHLAEAIQATFKRRGIKVPQSSPLAMTVEFATDAMKMSQWHAFLQMLKLSRDTYPFDRVIKQIEDFVMPIFEAIESGSSFRSKWKPGDGWQEK
ncbi:nucleotidyl transferase AbiEii/AbiGii toxin family protein [Planctomycetota bacterium]